MQSLTPRRALIVSAAMLACGLPALLAGSTGAAVWNLAGEIRPSAPYFSGREPGLLYVTLPLVVFGSLALFLAPGMLLAMAFARARTAEEWLLKGFALSTVVLGFAVAAVQELRGAPLTGAAFVGLASACTALAGAGAWFRAQRRRIEWPALHTAHVAPLIGVPLLFLVALTPKFFWEGFNGDGAHAFEATRLLLHQPLPFWPEGSGVVGQYPGVNSVLYLLPGSWFMRLFGEIEAAVRLPYVLFMGLLFAGLLSTARQGRKEPLGAAAHALLWLGVVSYSLVMAYSATYDPYCSDIALPATQDTLLVACFLGLVLAFQSGERGWMVLWTAFTLLCSPAGPVLIGAWLVAVVIAYRQRPWLRAAFLAVTTATCLVLIGAAPALLQRLGLPAPGGEHSAGALLSKFRYVLPTDVRRFLYLVVPCGIYPALAFFAWRRSDDASRALLVVVALVFGMYYLMAFVSLHYFAPAMILPLVIFWRGQRVALWERPRAAVAACLACALVAVGLALPAGADIYTGTREVGASLDASGLGGYDEMAPEYFSGMALLEELFTPGSDAAVPESAYAGASLSWSYYAQRAASDERPINYVLTSADTPAPDGAVRVAGDGAAALYVLDDERWEAHRSMRPAGSQGRSIYAVPRDLLFPTARAFERYAIIDVKGLLSQRAP